MKFLKKLLIVLVSLVALFLISALFIDGKYSVKREIVIDRNSEEVFDYIKYLKNQENYSVWAQMDPDMKRTYSGKDGEVGFVSAWDSDNEEVGKGEQEILKIEQGKRIDFELRFVEPFEAIDNVYFVTESIDDKTTKVIWGFNGEINYPWNIMILFMNFDEMLGPDLEEGLENLKNLMEEN